MNSMYFDKNSRGRMISLLELLLDMSYDDSGRYNDIHIKPEDCGAFSVEWSQEPWSEPDGEFKYAKFIHHIENYEPKKSEHFQMRVSDGGIAQLNADPNREPELSAEQEDELREGTDSKYLDIDWARQTTTTNAKPNWYVDYNEPYKFSVLDD